MAGVFQPGRVLFAAQRIRGGGRVSDHRPVPARPTDATIKNRVKRGLLTAVKPLGPTHHYFDGGEILRYWRACGLSAVPVPLPPSATARKRQLEADLKAIGC